MAHTHSSHGSHDTPSGVTEPDVVDVALVVKFAIGLTVVTVVAHIAMLLMFQTLDSRVAAATPGPMYPLAASQDDRRPPEPRLQGGVTTAAGRLLSKDELTDVNYGPKEALIELHKSEDAILKGYSWVDRSANIVRIPIADAMQRTVQQGLPTRAPAAEAASGAPAAPATEEKSK